MTDADQAPPAPAPNGGPSPAEPARPPRPAPSDRAENTERGESSGRGRGRGDDAGGPDGRAAPGGAEGRAGDGSPGGSGGSSGARRRRGSRGGRGRRGAGGAAASADAATANDSGGTGDGRTAPAAPTRGDGGGRADGGRDRRPDRADEAGPDGAPRTNSGGPPSAGEAAPAVAAPSAKPKIGDSRPAPAAPGSAAPEAGGSADGDAAPKRRRRRGGRGRGKGGQGRTNGPDQGRDPRPGGSGNQGGKASGGSRSGGGRGRGAPQPVTALTGDAVALDDETLAARRGRERKGKAVGRYLMAVHVQAEATQIAVLEGRSLIEHQVSFPADDITQIHGNIYLGRVQNVLPGMEAAFVDIGTPKNAVLYRSDARPDDDLDTPPAKGKQQPKIEEMLKAKQLIVCQVTKNPIAHKGARLTQEVSLPGRFVVLVPNSTTYGISKRLADDERKRLRTILDKVRPKGHGLIVRTAAEGVTASEIEADVARLARQWEQIEALAAKARNHGPTLLYREPDSAIRMIREELTNDFRKVVIDDAALFDQVSEYVSSISPEMAERVEYYDPATAPLPLFEKHHIHEQLHKALDRKVWLPSGGSLIIEHTEALTVIDVNTGKNVGKSSLEQTVFQNNLEAAEEVARQLRLRDIGGIIVIDFIDMEVAKNRDEVIKTFRAALARDKTRTQVFDISELGLVEMTRKRIGEGLLESFAHSCPHCSGRGLELDRALLPER